MTERLEEIKSVYEDYKELQKKGDFKQADIALLYLSENHIDWLINRIEELEKVISDLDENVAAFETLWLEEKRKNQRYKQALELIYKDTFYESENDLVSPIHVIRKRAEKALKGE